MKKTYIEPTTKVYMLNTKKTILTTSVLQVGNTIDSGEGDARQSDGDFWDENE